MGFENRKSIRIKTKLNVFVWPEGAPEGKGGLGEVLNLSETGLATHGALFAAPGDRLRLEFSLDSRKAPLKLAAKVVHSDAPTDGQAGRILRVQFLDVSPEDRLLLRQTIIQFADPKLAAQTGWGKVYFSAGQGIETKYRILSQAEQQQALGDRSYLSAKELIYLKKVQGFLEESLGSRTPGNFKLLGSRALAENGYAWMELNLPTGHLHLLAKVLWCKQEGEEKAEAGLSVLAIHKDEAMKLEKS
ncbi:MAG TPA: PilZ domain-containing protein [bacterium]|nr:PilZ domain-containing protein [bacterium]